MKVINNNLRLRDFKAWSGAIETKDKIIKEGKGDEFENLIDELFPEGLTETKLNDVLWFEDEMLFNELGIEEQ
jgi:hypothetical protein